MLSFAADIYAALPLVLSLARPGRVVNSNRNVRPRLALSITPKRPPGSLRRSPNLSKGHLANRDIIVIGGSSGAIAALREILNRLQADMPAAVFVVVHIPAGSVNILSTAIGASRLPVREAQNGLEIQHGHVYLAAPDRHLLLADGHMILGRGPHENMVRPAIDPLFRSAALHYGPRVIGVVLSGLLSDGAAGLKAIKRCGGLALVQDPSDALADAMPRSALETTTVDLCLASARIGDVLCDLAREQPGRALPIPPEIGVDVELAAGERRHSEGLFRAASLTPLPMPAPLICPSCGRVLSTGKLRDQAGHAHDAEALAMEIEGRVDEALHVALRIIGERADLVRRMARDSRRSRRPAVAQAYEVKAAEYAKYADMIREVMIECRGPRATE
jgi:two-component system, chemotaxis family, protein-glutamate methylesterase/glutaminase